MALVAAAVALLVAVTNLVGGSDEVRNREQASREPRSTTTISPSPVLLAGAPIPVGPLRPSLFRPAVALTFDTSWAALHDEQDDFVDFVPSAGTTGLLSLLRVELVLEPASEHTGVPSPTAPGVMSAPDDLAAWIADHPRLDATSR